MATRPAFVSHSRRRRLSDRCIGTQCHVALANLHCVCQQPACSRNGQSALHYHPPGNDQPPAPLAQSRPRIQIMAEVGTAEQEYSFRREAHLIWINAAYRSRRASRRCRTLNVATLYWRPLPVRGRFFFGPPIASAACTSRELPQPRLQPNVTPTLFLQFHQSNNARGNKACLREDSNRLAFSFFHSLLGVVARGKLDFARKSEVF